MRDNGTGNELKRIVSVTGLDVISETTFTPGGPSAGTMRMLGYDGHGSTRFLTELSTTVDQVFAYDAFGNALAFTPATALTNRLYSGEPWDPRVGLQYLRSRFYDPSTGRFPTFDTYSGDATNPLSLNKYLYTRGDPILGVDPSGRDFSLVGLLSSISIADLAEVLYTGAVAAVRVFAHTAIGAFYGSHFAQILGFYDGWITTGDINEAFRESESAREWAYSSAP
jgi:RHS repeat-associated protein